MFNIQKYLSHVVLALGLAAASLTTGATVLPTYHIDVADTAAADIGAIDILFSRINDGAAVTASLSHFSGTPLIELDRQGVVSGTSDGFTIGNDGTFNDLYLEVDGPFALDLNFSEGFLGFASASGSGSFFSIVLYDSFGSIIGEPTGALTFALSSTGVDVNSTSSLLAVTEVPAADAAVPEPADWMLMLTGLVFVVGMTRLNGRASVRSLAAA